APHHVEPIAVGELEIDDRRVELEGHQRREGLALTAHTRGATQPHRLERLRDESRSERARAHDEQLREDIGGGLEVAHWHARKKDERPPSRKPKVATQNASRTTGTP